MRRNNQMNDERNFVTVTYDAMGHRISEEPGNGGNSIAHHYDAYGREIHPNRRQNNHPVNGTITTYDYGSNGEIAETTRLIGNGHDEGGRVDMLNRYRLFSVPASNSVILTEEQQARMDAIP